MSQAFSFSLNSKMIVNETEKLRFIFSQLFAVNA